MSGRFERRQRRRRYPNGQGNGAWPHNRDDPLRFRHQVSDQIIQSGFSQREEPAGPFLDGVALMLTEEVFRTDSYLKECGATVVSVNDLGGIILDRTNFYQPAAVTW